MRLLTARKNIEREKKKFKENRGRRAQPWSNTMRPLSTFDPTIRTAPGVSSNSTMDNFSEVFAASAK